VAIRVPLGAIGGLVVPTGSWHGIYRAR